MYAADPEREDDAPRHTSYVHLVCMVMKAHSVEGLVSVGVVDLPSSYKTVPFCEVAADMCDRRLHSEVELKFNPLCVALLCDGRMYDFFRSGYKAFLIGLAEALTESQRLCFRISTVTGSFVPCRQDGVCLILSSSKCSPFMSLRLGLCHSALCRASEYRLFEVLFPNKYYRVGLQQDREVKADLFAIPQFTNPDTGVS
eukprot:Skav210350  [mRNA]  locus=scaffold1491:6103:11614:+ [translate_table: standard]